MLTIAVTAYNTEKGLRDLEKFEKILRSGYEVLCKSRCETIYSADCHTTSSNDFTVNAYPTAVNDYITESYVVQ